MHQKPRLPLQIAPLRLDEIETLRQLASEIWYAHFPSLISMAQIDYMFAQRYASEVIAAELQRIDTCWNKLEEQGEMRGFSCLIAATGSTELKLDKLYVHPRYQRRGYGGALIDHALQFARAQGRAAVVLAVNKHNRQAINAYLKHGFSVRESKVTDIGAGFVMDDFIMARSTTSAVNLSST